MDNSNLPESCYVIVWNELLDRVYLGFVAYLIDFNFESENILSNHRSRYQTLSAP